MLHTWTWIPQSLRSITRAKGDISRYSHVLTYSTSSVSLLFIRFISEYERMR